MAIPSSIGEPCPVYRTILLIRCPDQPGIIARYATLLYELGCNILHADQYTTDANDGRFFMRVEFSHEGGPDFRTRVADALAPLTTALGGIIQLHGVETPMRMGIAVSKYDHCLLDLLYRVKKGELAVEVPLVISNHPELRTAVEGHGIPFHHLPVQEDRKRDQEDQMLAHLKGQTDFLVLARYMQVLSDEFIQAYGKDVINIHHSFLPSFKGANPYRQAYERGVKIIGATAHYATSMLDEGPIIEQSVERVSIRDNVASLQSKGRHLEQMALARAVAAHIEHRIIRLEQRTVVFE